VRTLRTGLITGLLLCIVAAGCGGGGSDSKAGGSGGNESTTTTSTTKPDSGSGSSGSGDSVSGGSAADPSRCDVVSGAEVANVTGGHVEGTVKCGFEVSGDTNIGSILAATHSTVRFSRPPSEQWTALTTQQLGHTAAPVAVPGVGDEAYLVWDASITGDKNNVTMFFSKAGEQYQVDWGFPPRLGESSNENTIAAVMVRLADLRLSKQQ
jgi:hypothetical protein